jgi:serine/threonine protein phosphatase 1
MMKSNNNDYSKPNFKGRRFVCGDLHGGYLALKQVLEDSDFDYDNDLLICLGDVVDGWSQSKEVIDELLKIKNLVYLLGNHDEWSMEYYNGDMKNIHGEIVPSQAWYLQGGKETIDSLGTYETQDEKYLNFLKSGLVYYELDDMIFVHADLPNKMYDMKKMAETRRGLFIWERDLIYRAAHYRNTRDSVDERYREVYFGHTPIMRLVKKVEEHNFKPMKMTNVWAMDTGAAFDGKISLMDIDTKELFQSDFVMQMYPYERGRNELTYHELLTKTS